MALTDKARIMTYLDVKSLGDISDDLVTWLISTVERHIKNRTQRNCFEAEKAEIKANTLAFVDSDPDTITDSGSGFVTTGFAAGDIIAVSGSSKNDGIYTVATVVAGTITLIATDELTAEAAGSVIGIRAFKEITEYHSGDGATGYFLTNEWPINSVTSLHDDTDRNYTSGYLIDTDDYVWYEDGLVRLDSGVFNGGQKNIKIIYTAGYGFVPSDLEYLATKWTAMVLQAKDRLGISSQGDPDGSMTFFNTFLDADMMSILNYYRRIDYDSDR
jgi:hypothetical protein